MSLLIYYLAPMRKNIDALRKELDSTRIQAYMDDFETKVEDYTLIVGSVPLEEIQREEKRQREERIKAELLVCVYN
jgi:hypothetical protein